MKTLGIENENFLKDLNAIWLQKFFTNEYCVKDRANAKAASYVREIVAHGGFVVYLSGRDVPRMGAGTETNLKLRGFPVDPESTVLMLKPDAAIPDLDFKVGAFAKIATLGDVVAGFENEPANLNVIASRFPQAQMIFLDTIHSAKPDVPTERAEWVSNFRIDE